MSLFSSDSLFLSKATRRRVQVHPVVIFSILDHYSRRAEDQERVIGTLLGTVDSKGVVDVTDSFPVLHTEVDNVAVDIKFHRSMMDLHLRASPNVAIVGWYATGNQISDNSVIIHDFYTRETGKSPIHLTVDTLLEHDLSLSIRAYTGVSLTLASTVGSLFQPVEAFVSGDDNEKLGLELLTRAADTGATLASLGQVEASLRQIAAHLHQLRDHARAVVDGKAPADPKLGVALLEAVQALPAVEPETFARVFDNATQDLLMVSYLAKLSRSQLALADKIQQI